MGWLTGIELNWYQPNNFHSLQGTYYYQTGIISQNRSTGNGKL